MSFLNDEIDEITGKEKLPENVKKFFPDEKKEEIDYEDIIPEDEKIQLNKKFQLDPEKYQDFTEELYPDSLNFYDFEVFRHDWLVVIINPVEKIKTIIANDSKALKRYYNAHKEQIWVGYNSRNYDVFIMKSILLGLNPKKTNDYIIEKGLKGYQICKDFRNVQFYDFDIYTKNGLKTLEGFMGDDIRETEVDFNLPRKLNPPEMRQTVKYCQHDVDETVEVFRRRKELFESQVQLIETFDLPKYMIGLTQAQLTANILGCKSVDDRGDEFDLELVDTLRIKKYDYAKRWFENPVNMDYKKSFNLEVCGVPHQFGWGGLHGCPVEPLHAKGNLFHVDVTSYYPSIMIVYDFLTRNCKDKKAYKKIYEMRVALKKAGKKKEQAPYKIVLNGTYGICKDKFSSAYDPRQANNVCVNGQLMLLDLLEHLENYITLIQSNTDGLIVQVKDESKIEKFREICNEWEERTGMGLGFDEIDEIWQKDVNNYVFRFSNGKLERKGAYVMELDDLNNNLPIVNKAIVDYLTKDIMPEETIKACNDMKEFQIIVKVSSNYRCGYHNGEYLNDKTFRVFASRNNDDTSILKCKYPIGYKIETAEGSRNYKGEKFADTPEHCFIYNDDVNGLSVTEKLDKRWYIDLAEKRLCDFGINLNDDSLF